MFGFAPRFPLRGLALVAIGFVLASALIGGGPGAGVATGLGVALLLPFLALKLLFVLFLFGALFRFAGAGAGWRPGPRSGRGFGGPWQRGWDDRAHSSDEPYPWERPSQHRANDPERQQWEENLRQARAEVEGLDRPAPWPGDDFEPPTPTSSD